MTEIIAVTNQKGGVAKTTTAVNLAAAFAKQGSRTLLVDIDPQGNASVSSAVSIGNLTAGTYEVLLGECTIEEAITQSESGYDILPTNPHLAGAQVELLDLEHQDLRLKHALESVLNQYDVVLIDTPPSLNVLTINALAASTGVLIPVQCEYFALEGLSGLITTLAMVRKSLNPQLEIIGVVRTMYDGRNSLTVEVSRQLNKHFQEKVFKILIPRNIRLAEAPSHGVSVLDYDPSCRGAKAYVALANEINERRQISHG
ncbi:MAG: chromosome partitioning protein [Saprospiraceae bacterium]|jgi:chromosome partitioning protein